jgi:Pvc16 N-terminal domain
MATVQAIGSVAEAVARLLGQAWQPSLLNGIDAQFEVYQGKDFETSPSQAQITTGVSVFVYQVSVNKVQRTLPPSTPQHRRPLPLDIWLLLTAWAQNVSTEHTLLGWAMRTIDDNPILSSGFLNAAIPGVFRPEETVELAPAELTNAEIFQLWQVLPNSLQLSVPYVARVVRVESELTVPQGSPVVTRELEFGAVSP